MLKAPRFFNPDGVAAPISRYSHAVELPLAGRRLVISGQVGLRPDGSLAEGLEAQAEAAWDNLVAILAAADMGVNDLVKINVFCTRPDSVVPTRAIRDRRLNGHAPASTYIEVAGLANPAWLFEIDGEAFKA